MSGDDVFSMDMPDINSIIQGFNLLKEDVRQAVAQGLDEGAEIIENEMKRLAAEVYNAISIYLNHCDVKVSKSGWVGLKIGLNAKDIYDINYWSALNDLEKMYGEDGDYDDEARKIAIIAMTFEFGRPGNSSTFRKNEYRFWSYRRLGKGKLIFMTQRKGAIQPRSFIRRGFDNKVVEASNALIKKVENAEDNRMKG